MCTAHSPLVVLDIFLLTLFRVVLHTVIGFQIEERRAEDFFDGFCSDNRAAWDGIGSEFQLLLRVRGADKEQRMCHLQ